MTKREHNGLMIFQDHRLSLYSPTISIRGSSPLFFTDRKVDRQDPLILITKRRIYIYKSHKWFLKFNNAVIQRSRSNLWKIFGGCEKLSVAVVDPPFSLLTFASTNPFFPFFLFFLPPSPKSVSSFVFFVIEDSQVARNTSNGSAKSN